MNSRKVLKLLTSETLGIPNVLFLSSILAVLYFSLGFYTWKFVTVGDDWATYNFAVDIAKKSLLINPFDMQGVYRENPVLGSIYQAIFLKIFNYSHLAWRFSNIILIIPLSLFFFIWVKNSFNTNVAFLSTLLLQTSFYLANFFKIGYINPQALVLFLLALMLAERLCHTFKKRYAVFLSITLGLAFYIYIGPLFPIILWPYLIPFIKNRETPRKKIVLLGIIVAIYFSLIIPGLLDFTNIETVSTRTVLKKEYANNWQMLINILHGFSLFYKNYDYFYNHFVSGPYLEVITRILAFIGSYICLRRILKKEYLIFMLIYLTTVTVITLTAPYAYSPTTRGIFYLPFGFLFAGIALNHLFKKTTQKLLIGAIIISVFLLNLYQSQLGVFKETGYTQSALIIKAMQEEKERVTSSKPRAFFLQIDTAFQHDISSNISYYQRHYDIKDMAFSHIPLSRLTCGMLQNSLIITRADESQSINSFLGQFPCQAKTTISTIDPKIEL